ncbi:MAG: hypothetical protein ACTSRZ_00715 [Promethearchaeota archaeon]
MSSKKKLKDNQLENNLKIKTNSNSRGIRLRCIDFLKGLAMIAVICAHTSFWINDPNKMWAHGIAWMIFQFCGPAGFAVLTSVNVTLSTKIKQAKGINNKRIFGSIIKRALIFFIIGFFFVGNFSGNSFVEVMQNIADPIYLFRIHIFQLIAISQIIAFLSLFLKKSYRILFAVFIILIDIFGYPFVVQQMEAKTFITPEFFEGKYGYEALKSVYGWIYLIFFRQSLQMGVIPWIIIPILSSIGGEIVYKKIIIPVYNSTNKPLRNLNSNSSGINFNSINKPSSLEKNIKTLYIYAFILYATGILGGLKLETYFRGAKDLMWLNSGAPYYIDAYPLFLFNGSWQSLLYCTGIVLAFVGIGIYTNDLRRNKDFEQFNITPFSQCSLFYKFWLLIEKKMLSFITALETFGKYSMSAFLLHFVAWFVLTPLNVAPNFPPRISFIIMFSYAFLLILLFNVWDKKLHGKFTLEYFLSPKILKIKYEKIAIRGF